MPAGTLPEAAEEPTADGSGDEDQDGDGRPPDADQDLLLQDPRAGEWGNLPVRLQRTLDAVVTDDVPLRYRRWLVQYHRRDTP